MRWSRPIGGGSNAMGLFYPFLDDNSVAMYRRRGRGPWPRHATSTRRRSRAGRPGVLHGNRTYLLQDE